MESKQVFGRVGSNARLNGKCSAEDGKVFLSSRNNCLYEMKFEMTVTNERTAPFDLGDEIQTPKVLARHL